MTHRELVESIEGIFAIGKGIAYLLFIAAMIKYLSS